MTYADLNARIERLVKSRQAADRTAARRNEHYNLAVQSWDDAYADRNGLPRANWSTS